MIQSAVVVKFTYEDYLLFPQDGKRHELIDGEHFMSPAPKTFHQSILGHLFTAFSNFLKQSKLGKVFMAPTDVVLSDLDVVEPDLLFIASANLHFITENNIQGAPDLVVEVLSPSSRKTDEMIKRKLYQQYGVQEYWIVDPELQMVKIYRMTESGYVRTAELSSEKNEILTTPLLPGMEIELTAIFE
ncbi:MAG: Uma2 family endonuclease [Nitrospirae bacterium]|nr:Uma2 family endonuclease [Candidatus Troglogloeales bacterium]